MQQCVRTVENKASIKTRIQPEAKKPPPKCLAVLNETSGQLFLPTPNVAVLFPTGE